MLGHSQMRTTMDIYSHVMPALAREAADRMGTLLLTGGAGPIATTTATTDDSGRPPEGERPGHRGGAEGTRTPDPHTASVVRYQLRHSPVPARSVVSEPWTTLQGPGRPPVQGVGSLGQISTPRAASHGTGSIRLPFIPPWCTSKCRWGPVDWPRLPSSAIVSPASTYWPGSTRIESMWP
jgi:hypothetical protein